MHTFWRYGLGGREVGGQGDRHLVAVGLVVSLSLIVGVAVFLERLSMDVLVGALTVLVLSLVTVPVLQWVARREGDVRLAHMLVWAFVLKFVFTLVRYYVITVVYSNNADAGVYSYGGAEVAHLLRRGVLTLSAPSLEGRGVETQRIAAVVGLIYLVTGVSRYAASFVFSWICFVGQILMWRAFRRAVPEGDHQRYAVLVLFLPSILFWPSSIGKEALMVGCIGVVSYGAAQILGERVTIAGVATFVGGALGLFLIRPHMALIALVSLGFASAIGTVAGFQKRASTKVFFIRVVALVVLVAGSAFATTQLSRFFGNDDSSEGKGISGVLARTQAQTGTGGSEFAPPSVSSPLELPAGVVTVLFRPFPYEARNLNGLIASGEGLLFFGLFVAGRRRILTWFKMAPKRPYLVFAAAYAFVFIVAFSYIGNFGILARQRTQMLPLVMTLIAMFPAPRTRRSFFGMYKPKGEKENDADAPEQSHGLAPATLGSSMSTSADGDCLDTVGNR